jgi:RHS repeat-associated protein
VKVEEVDAEGNTRVLYSDALGRAVRVEDEEGHAEELRHDARYWRERKDRKGYRTTREVDAAGRTRKVLEYEQGATWPRYTQEYRYEDAARRSTYIDRRGMATVVVVDGRGEEERRRRGKGEVAQEERWERNETGQVVRAVDGNGVATDFEYNGAGQQVAWTVAAGKPEQATWRQKLDRLGRPVAVKGPRETGQEFDWHYTWDDLGRQVRAEDAEGHVTVRAFEAEGNVVCEKKPKGNPRLAQGGARGLTLAALLLVACEGSHATQWQWDEEHRLVAVTDAAGGEHTLVRDKAGRPRAWQDPNGNLTTYEYDRRGLETARYLHLDAHPRLRPGDRERVPGAGGPPDIEKETGTLTWHKTWDANGNPWLVTDPKGQQTEHTYGLLDRLERREYRHHAQPQEWPSLLREEFETDPNGNRVRTLETKRGKGGGLLRQESRHEFDALDRRTRQWREGQGVRSAYNPAGQRVSVAPEQGDVRPTDMAYNGLGLVREVRLPGGTVSLSYWPDGLLKKVRWPNGLEEGRCYSATGRLVEWVLVRGQVGDTCEPLGTLLHRQRREYDSHGNPVRWMDQRTEPQLGLLLPEQELMAAYDELDRLVATGSPQGPTLLYKLDAVGQRLGLREVAAREVPVLGGEAYTAAPASMLLRDESLRYNRVGWLLERKVLQPEPETQLFGWDLNGNNTSRKDKVDDWRFAWDIRNTLTAVYNDGHERGRYDYDSERQRVARYTHLHDSRYVLDGPRVLQEWDSTQRLSRRYHHATLPLAVSETWGQEPPSTRFLHVDVLGSVVDVTTLQGELSDTPEYDAWGHPLRYTARNPDTFKLSYTGHQYDSETWLLYARARYYDWSQGRFLSRDPLELPPEAALSLHPYAYAANNPLRYTDPTGQFPNDSPGLERMSQGHLRLASRCSGGDTQACTEQKLLLRTGALATAGGFGFAAVGEAGGVSALASRLGLGARLAWMTYAVPILATGSKFVSDVRLSGLRQAVYANAPALNQGGITLAEMANDTPTPLLPANRIARNVSRGGRKITATAIQSRVAPLEARSIGDHAWHPAPFNSKDELLRFLEGRTLHSQMMVDSIREGNVGINLIGDTLFEKYYKLNGGQGNPLSVQGFTIRNMIYLRRDRASVAAAAAHEGSHALDSLYHVPSELIADEMRAFQHQIDFQRAIGEPLFLDSDEAIRRYVLEAYSKE